MRGGVEHDSLPVASKLVYLLVLAIAFVVVFRLVFRVKSLLLQCFVYQ